jgi:RNA polymerase sigma factor (sigma-70 family)
VAENVTLMCRYAVAVARTFPELDETLEFRFVHGGDEALREAYDAHGALIYSFCRRSLGDERAKDVTQEVFVSAWKARHRFDPSKGTLAGWFIGIAKHRIIDNVRSEQRHDSRRFDGVSENAAVVSEVDAVGDRMLVAEALAELPERSRQIIQLAFFQDLTHAEVAERTGQPLGTVKSDIRRGLARIRRHLESAHG